MEIRPILSAMTRNKLGAILIAAQIAFTLAIICNGAFIVWQRYETMTRPTGMDFDNIFAINSQGIGSSFDSRATVASDLELIRNIPGVIAATSTNAIPLSNGGWGERIQASMDEGTPQHSTGVYMMNEQGIEALGVTLAGGRNFTADEMVYPEENSGVISNVALITQELSDLLYPEEGESALGRTIFFDSRPVEVIGIIEHMHGSWVGWDGLGQVTILAGQQLRNSSRYLIRTEPGMRDAVMPQVEEGLAASNTQRIIRRLRSLEEYAAGSYSRDNTVAVTMMTVIILLVIITAMGIIGLVSFLVSQRTKQIGTRRALGARKFHVVRYFLVENWLITTIGLSVGLILTVALNMLLVEHLAMTRLDIKYLPIGLIAIWLLGFLASLGPARKAAHVSPAIATRTV